MVGASSPVLPLTLTLLEPPMRTCYPVPSLPRTYALPPLRRRVDILLRAKWAKLAPNQGPQPLPVWAKPDWGYLPYRRRCAGDDW